MGQYHGRMGQVPVHRRARTPFRPPAPTSVRRAVGRVKRLGDAIAPARGKVDMPTEEAPAE